MPAARVEGRAVTTVEGETPELARLRAAFHAHGAAQCGICTPGMLLTAAELLARDRSPDLRRGRAGAGRCALPLHRLSQHHRGGGCGGAG
jgi:aldehyde oxidoreductase